MYCVGRRKDDGAREGRCLLLAQAGTTALPARWRLLQVQVTDCREEGDRQRHMSSQWSAGLGRSPSLRQFGDGSAQRLLTAGIARRKWNGTAARGDQRWERRPAVWRPALRSS
jgi:hypothetical protein